MDRSKSVCLVVLLGALLPGVLESAASGWAPDACSDERPPNVVFFLVDDLGWSDLACHGSRFHDTPNIDRLAREGARFTDAYATSHVCSPSRASLMTGKYPARLKLTDWLPGRKDFPFQQLKNAHIRQALPLQETTLAEALKQHGYRTGHFGKWHLGEAPAGPLRQGFDIQVPQDWFKGWPKAGYHYPFELEALSGKKGDYLTDRLTDEALQFIDQNRDGPFFLYLSHFAVHDPIQGRPDLVGKYESRRAKLPPAEKPFALEGNPDAKPSSSFTRERLDEMIGDKACAGYRVLPNRLVKVKQRQDNPHFAAMVESVDQSLGRVVARLKALGLEQNTIILFTSDNGGMAAANFGRPDRVVAPDELDAAYSTSNLPLRGAKGWLYEGGIRVPLIIKWPGQIRAGLVIDEPVTGTDYYPTLLDMVGMPKLPDQHVDGTSLKPLFHGASALDRDALYWHFPHYSNHGMQSPGGAIRRGRYKLLEYFENGTVQLFDLEADPGERNDLAEIHPEIAGELLEMLRQWRKVVGAEMMEPNPDFDEPAAHADGGKLNGIGGGRTATHHKNMESSMHLKTALIIGAATAATTTGTLAQNIPPDKDLEYPRYSEKPGDRIISRSEYHKKLQGFWLGQCIANWTGLRTEGVKKTAPFFTDNAWGTNQGSKNQKIEFVLVEEGAVWGADDDTDIEYIYQDALDASNTSMLTPQNIRDAWLKHIKREENNFLWVSNEKALHLMMDGMLPPATSLPENNPYFDQIDAQLTTEIFGLLAPARPDVALKMAHLPIRTTAYREAEWIAEFYVVMHALAARVDPELPRKDQVLWLAAQARQRLPDESFPAKMYDFIKREYEANPDKNNWEQTRDKLHRRHTGVTTDGYNYRSWFDAGINFGASLVSLFYGEGDFKRTVQIGTLCGYDSDNPTATWGGLLGFMMGPDAIEDAFGGKKLSRLYHIGRTRIHFPDRTPDRDGDDAFDLMALRGVHVIDRVVIEEMGGGVDLDRDLWCIPDGR